MKNFAISTQLILSLIVIFGMSYNAHGKTKNKTVYKVENCDCLGFSDDIPTFLSDLPGAEGIDIQAEGTSLDDAEKMAQNMCVETYRNYASVAPGEEEPKTEKQQEVAVTQTGCQVFKSTNNGDWESI